MVEKLRSQLTYANVMATIAVFIALSGGAYAAFHLPRNSVKSRNIVNGQVKPADLARPQRLKSAHLISNPSFNCANAPNQWASSRPATNGIVGYFRDAGGVVHLTGQAALCGSAPTPEVFTLPAGYRPPVLQDLAVLNNSNVIELWITQAGEVLPLTQNNGAIFSLNGITFRCGPARKHGCP